MITKQLAEEIVEQTMIRLNRNLNVMAPNGMIPLPAKRNESKRFMKAPRTWPEAARHYPSQKRI